MPPKLLVNPGRRHDRGDARPEGASPSASPTPFHARLPGYAPTRIVDAPQLAADLGLASIAVKDESRRLGLPAFKILGASWAVYRLLVARLGHEPEWRDLDELRASFAPLGPLTLVAATDGNHGRAVAHMARRLGYAARIFVPAGTAPARIDGIESEGAPVTVVDGTYDDAVCASAALASDDVLVVSDTSWVGYTEVPRTVIEGYATIFAEVDAQLAEPPEVVVVPMGVGALAAAVVRHYAATATIVVVEPLSAACGMESAAAGRPVEVPGPHDSIMAGLNCGSVSIVAWPTVAAGADAFVAVDDAAAERAMRDLAAIGVVAGETGASALAGLRAAVDCGLPGLAGKRALVLCTEGATDPVAYERIVGRPSVQAAGVAMIEHTVDGSGLDQTNTLAAVTELCDALEGIDADGWYPVIEVVRPWSRHNPQITGEFARPGTIRWYLERELGALLALGATVTVRASRPETPLDDPALLRALDEVEWEMRAKKLFLFAPERMALSMERIAHYCGTPAESFQRYVLFTNYAMHVEEFRTRFPDAEGPERTGVQMPAWHHRTPNQDGVTLVDIGVGPSNAKTVTDHLAVLRPDAMLMIGHCAGLRNHQDIGDYVLATAYLRDDHILDHALPTTIPVIPNHRLNSYLLDALDTHQARYRIGTVLTTANRNWELEIGAMEHTFEQSRAVAVDMESATIAANGFRYRIPSATLLAISDKPLHGAPKLPQQAKQFYAESRRAHLEIALECIDRVRHEHPAGIPNADIRSPGEPLFGAPAVE